MARTDFLARIREGVLVLDGAMGTQLFARGIDSGQCNEVLNVERPEVVADVHRAYLAAGSDAILTNTFGCNRYVLGRHGYGDRVGEFALAAAKLAREAAGEDRYVIGDIGPCGDFLEPLGAVQADDLKATIAELAGALAEGGVDALMIETVTALDEVQVGIEAIRSVCDLPILVSLAYDPAGDEARTMMGVDPAAAVDAFASQGIAAIGYNCGTLDMTGYVKLTEAYAAALEGTDILLCAEPNAGKPDLVDGQAVYSLSPEEFGAEVVRIRDAGARLIGGCCGTSPEHIAAAAQRLRS